jgi:hypothetical protein
LGREKGGPTGTEITNSRNSRFENKQGRAWLEGLTKGTGTPKASLNSARGEDPETLRRSQRYKGKLKGEG